MQQEPAETLALEALAWLASHDELLPVFLGSSGVSAQELRDRAADPETLASVLDFLMMDDAWITAFCDGAGYDYTDPMRARAMLPGGDLPHWT